MKKNPIVSIVLPVYNGEKYLRESIQSIISQTYKNWELIIVNDCSTDNTLEIIKEFQSIDARIKLISNSENQKLPNSLNIGYKEAIGDLFTWTSDDNLYLPTAIDEMVKLFVNDIDLGFVFCAQEIIDDKGNVKESSVPKYKLSDLIYKNICGACFMYKKSIAERIGLYNNDLFCAEDYDYFCRLALNTKVIYYPQILYKYRKHPNNLSATKVNLADKNANAIRETYVTDLINKFKPNYFELQYIYYKLYKATGLNCFMLKSILMNPVNLIKIIVGKIKI